MIKKSRIDKAVAEPDDLGKRGDGLRVTLERGRDGAARMLEVLRNHHESGDSTSSSAERLENIAFFESSLRSYESALAVFEERGAKAALAKRLVATESLPDDVVQMGVPLTPAERAKKLATEVAARQQSIAPIRHPNRDFFIADIVDYSFKSDMAGMDAPIFSLATKPDLKRWTWTSQDGNRSVVITPGVDVGRATIFDKDILIYAASQLVAAINAGRPPSKTVRYAVYDFLTATNRRTDGEEYGRHKEALRRLTSTRLETNIKTGRRNIGKGFGILDSWGVAEKDPEGRVASVEITLSDWLYNSITAMEILTISEDYFRLRKALERRIYELARKHMGHKSSWSISLESLYEKSGSTGDIRNFRRYMKNIVDRNDLPTYSITTAPIETDVMLTFEPRAALVDKSV